MNRASSILIVAAGDEPFAQVALALCAAASEVGFGEGIEIALARSGDAVQAPEWVQLFPEGPQIDARDGRKWTLEDPAVIVAAFQANKAALAFDINHATELLGHKGGEAPARGWIKAVEHRPGQGVWGQVDWTPAGAAAIASGEYRYVSPAFRFDKTTKAIFALSSAALVTHPALVMPALARVEGDNPANLETDMTLRANLLVALCLADTATDEEILAAATTSVGLARDARDPTKLVPASDLSAAVTRAEAAETALAARETADQEGAVTAAVDAAVAAGKITPASKEHYLGLARANLTDFNAAMAVAPVVTKPTNKAADPDQVETDNHGLDAAQLDMCASLNLEPAAFAANLPKKAA